MNLDDYLGSNPVMIVAHADDEVLWGGALLAVYGPSFTVVCATKSAVEPERFDCFAKVCDVFGAEAIAIDFSETIGTELTHLDSIDLRKYSSITTHSLRGEYGSRHPRPSHPHHDAVRAYVDSRYADKNRLYFGRGEPEVTDTVRLDDEQLELRLRALQCYDFPCRRPPHLPMWKQLLRDHMGSSEKELAVETYRRQPGRTE